MERIVVSSLRGCVTVTLVSALSGTLPSLEGKVKNLRRRATNGSQVGEATAESVFKEYFYLVG